MKQEYINRLPQDICLLVQEIEYHIDSEIYVKVDESRPQILACEVDKHGATILTPMCDHFPEESVLHELLHIRRFCVNNVPRIVVCDSFQNWTPELETDLTHLDNNLEHLIIVPEEIEYRPDRKEYWKTRICNKIETFDLSNRNNQNQAFDALIYWVFIHHIFKEDDLIKKIDEITSLDVKKLAQEFHNEIIPYLYSKGKLVKVCFKYINISDQAVCLEYIDCKNNSSNKNSLSNVQL